jgi:MFS transporter, FSR family, fosmidomycin resistance protein
MNAVRLKSGPALAGLMAALAVEFADELVDGTKSAAMPLIRHDLSLSYVQVGLLAAVPLLLGSLIELPVGVLSGTGRRRRRVALAGGVVFVAAVLGVALAHSFLVLLAALVAFFPASGAFVSLTQSALLDADPPRRHQLMARWTLAGSAGDVAGPLLVAAVLAVGGSWRLAFALVGAAGAVSWLAVAGSGRVVLPRREDPTEPPEGAGEQPRGDDSPHPAEGTAVQPRGDDPPHPPEGVGESDGAQDSWPGLRAALQISLQAGAFRWLTLLEVADLLLDVFSAFLALYLVAVVHVSPAIAALGVAVRLGAGLAGDVLLIGMLERFSALRVLRVSVLATGLLFPAFLLVPGLGLKLVALAAVSIATAPWYPVLKAELFASLPGRSGLAVSLGSASGLVGGLGPLAVGLLAQHFGLTWALASLAGVPVALLAAPARRRPRGPEDGLD